MDAFKDDAMFVAQLKRGEALAFETLVRKFTMPLLRTARRFMHAEEDARDAVQEAFIAAFKSVARFEENAQLSTWLHRITINSCLMKLRAQRRRPEEDIEQHLPRILEDGHQETMLQRAEVSHFVRGAIAQLPDTYRDVLLLRDIEELSTDETAQVLGVTANAVKIRLHRARQAFRTLIDPQTPRFVRDTHSLCNEGKTLARQVNRSATRSFFMQSQQRKGDIR